MTEQDIGAQRLRTLSVAVHDTGPAPQPVTEALLHPADRVIPTGVPGALPTIPGRTRRNRPWPPPDGARGPWVGGHGRDRRVQSGGAESITSAASVLPRRGSRS